MSRKQEKSLFGRAYTSVSAGTPGRISRGAGGAPADNKAIILLFGSTGRADYARFERFLLRTFLLSSNMPAISGADVLSADQSNCKNLIGPPKTVLYKLGD